MFYHNNADSSVMRNSCPFHEAYRLSFIYGLVPGTGSILCTIVSGGRHILAGVIGKHC